MVQFIYLGDYGYAVKDKMIERKKKKIEQKQQKHQQVDWSEVQACKPQKGTRAPPLSSARLSQAVAKSRGVQYRYFRIRRSRSRLNPGPSCRPSLSLLTVWWRNATCPDSCRICQLRGYDIQRFGVFSIPRLQTPAPLRPDSRSRPVCFCGQQHHKAEPVRP